MRLSVLVPAGGCKGTTKLGKPCQGKDVYENGFCKHHGGEGKSLIDRRFPVMLEQTRNLAERLRKRSAKWERKHPEIRAMMEARRAKASSE